MADDLLKFIGRFESGKIMGDRKKSMPLNRAPLSEAGGGGGVEKRWEPMRQKSPAGAGKTAGLRLPAVTETVGGHAPGPVPAGAVPGGTTGQRVEPYPPVYWRGGAMTSASPSRTTVPS